MSYTPFSPTQIYAIIGTGCLIGLLIMGMFYAFDSYAFAFLVGAGIAIAAGFGIVDTINNPNRG